ncbi:hypothetical protein [Streptomyces sp. Ag109_O5-1]|uniref:hypothetical protein n=1 Tax=Streptomyces sp. Ag109_O5-1 TaxID=1938851 RepID=UPI000F4DD3D1|nr:hypothetical protein [Streptomyces sp. Ag109_O5-1]
MRPELEVLAALGVDSAVLDAAPGGPLRFSGGIARVHPTSPDRRCCSSCGALPYATQRLDLRWRDSCRDCMLIGFDLAWS